MWKNFKEFCKKNKFYVFCCFVILVGGYYLLFSTISKNAPTIKYVPYNEFLEYVDNGDVDTIYYSKQDNKMTFTLYNDVTRVLSEEDLAEYEYGIEDKRETYYPAYDTFRQEMLLKGARTEQILPKTTAYETFATLLSALITLWFIVVITSAVKGQFNSKGKKDLIQKSDVSFDDIIGHEEILDDLKFITELIKDPTIGDTVGAKLPKGLLLTGPPGTGKTLIAKAISHEADVPFLYQNASGFVELFVGMGARRVRELFKIARDNAPCIIFIDEIDAIGMKRGGTNSNTEHDQTINAILQEMDGFSSRDGVFIIAATNRPESLDSALVRSGRFDRQIAVNPPRDWRVRKELFKHYLDKFTTEEDIELDTVSKQISGFTGADISMICNEASIIATMKKKDAIDRECIEEAIDKKIFKGNRAKDKEHFKEDKTIVAYHESGHAVMSYLLGEPIARASIQATVSGVGGVVFNEDKDTLFRTNKDYSNRVLICYGGRASEEIKFETVTTGASNDITQATDIMLKYIERFGFDSSFGLLDMSVLTEEHLLEGHEITEKLSEMSKKLYAECKELLSKHYDLVECLAQKLLEVETLTGQEIQELFTNIDKGE